jgi:hypothetical protein
MNWVKKSTHALVLATLCGTALQAGILGFGDNQEENLVNIGGSSVVSVGRNAYQQGYNDEINNVPDASSTYWRGSKKRSYMRGRAAAAAKKEKNEKPAKRDREEQPDGKRPAKRMKTNAQN